MSIYKGRNLIAGHNVLYGITGQNTDGAMTQKAATDNFSNVDLSNLSATGNKVIDGQWVRAGVTVFSDKNFTQNETATFNISSYLPDDDYDYEVVFSAYFRTGAASGNSTGCSLYSGTGTTKTGSRLGRVVTRSAANVMGAGNTILPIYATDRNVTWRNIDSSGTSSGCGLSLDRYRRIGKNS